MGKLHDISFKQTREMLLVGDEWMKAEKVVVVWASQERGRGRNAYDGGKRPMGRPQKLGGRYSRT